MLASSTDDANDFNRSLTSIHILLQQRSNSTERPSNQPSNRRRRPSFRRSVEEVPVGIAWEVGLEAGRNIVLVGDRTVPEEDRTVLGEGRIDLGEDRKTAK